MMTMQTFDAQRYEAFVRLLARSDPEDLPRRAHVLRCPGDPNRLGALLPLIVMGWVQRRCLEIGGEEPLAPATRMGKPRMHQQAVGLPAQRPAVAAYC